MREFEQIELVQRATVIRTRRQTHKSTDVNSRKSRKRRQNKPENTVQRDLARLRAVRRMAVLFPDVFELVYADERHKAGLGPKVSNIEGLLSDAVETYKRYHAYHLAPKEADNGVA